MDGSLQRNRLILIGGIAVTLVLYFIAYWLPHRRETARLHEKIREVSEEISHQDQQAKYLLGLRGELAQIEAHNHLMTGRFPESLNMPEFLATVHRLGESEGVSASDITPQLVTKLLDLDELPIRLTLVGPFPAIVRVIYKLETLPRKVEITDVGVKDENRPETGDDVVEAQINVKLLARPAKSAAEPESSG